MAVRQLAFCGFMDTLLVTLLPLMQAVQAFTRRGEPLTTARILWMFGFQRRLVRRWE
jgi:hypothetical protein